MKNADQKRKREKVSNWKIEKKEKEMVGTEATFLQILKNVERCFNSCSANCHCGSSQMWGGQEGDERYKFCFIPQDSIMIYCSILLYCVWWCFVTWYGKKNFILSFILIYMFVCELGLWIIRARSVWMKVYEWNNVIQKLPETLQIFYCTRTVDPGIVFL